MLHRWEYSPDSADDDGYVRYLMVAFSHSLVERCMAVFPELRNRLTGITFPTNALKFGIGSSQSIRRILSRMNDMDELGRLCEMFRLLPVIFTSSDHTLAGKPMSIERDVRRMQQICAYVMAHYIHTISLDDIAAEVGMNRSAFCSYFKRCKGMTFSQYVTQYRLNTACELLKHSQSKYPKFVLRSALMICPISSGFSQTPWEYLRPNTEDNFNSHLFDCFAFKLF